MKECKHKFHPAGEPSETPLGLYLVLYCEKCGRYKEATKLEEK